MWKIGAVGGEEGVVLKYYRLMSPARIPSLPPPRLSNGHIIGYVGLTRRRPTNTPRPTQPGAHEAPGG